MKGVRSMTISERLIARRVIDPKTGCWRYRGAKRDGYGLIRLNGKTINVHRVSYQEFIGPIPEGLEIDHVRSRGCQYRDCFNPEHLEAITKSENVRRSDAGKVNGARQRAKTHCPYGHPFDSENTRVRPNGGRDCRACNRIRVARIRQYA